MFNIYLYLSDINDCSPDPCQNGATCDDEVSDYTCTCMAGYDGKNCTQSKFHLQVEKKVFLCEAPPFICLKRDSQ